MSGRGRLAVGLALVLPLGAWSGPAYAWAPERPEVEGGDHEGVDDEGTDGEPPIDEREPDDPVTDPSLADDEGGIDPSAPATEEPAAPSPGPDVNAPTTTHDVPADDFEAEAGLAPGGYHGHGVILERPPPDGRNHIIAGSILVPLGTLATVSSAVGLWMTIPDHCAERLGAAGIEATSARCKGLFAFNAVRTTYGLLMLGSGATILAIGLIQREKYRRWRHQHGMRARVEPLIGLPGRGTASLGLRLRF